MLVKIVQFLMDYLNFANSQLVDLLVRCIFIVVNFKPKKFQSHSVFLNL